jgi:hypothetical protein
MPALPKCAAVARDVIGAGAVPVEQSVGVEAVEGQGVAGEKLEEAEENKDDDDDDDDSGSDDDEDEESGDEESKLLNNLKHKQLVDLYQELAGWEPHPQLASYHISFLKNYLALLVHFQQHRTSKVSEKINKSLFNWICNQKTYLKWYKQGVSEEKNGKFHIDDRYVRYLKKLWVQVSLKVEGEGED